MGIKRHLLLERKAMTNLDSIFKHRDTTWQTNVHIVKAMVFPVVMYGCESWIIKKTERWRIDALKVWCWRRLFESPLDCKEIKPVHPEGNQSWIFIERTKCWSLSTLQYSGCLMQRANLLEKTLMLGKIDGKRRRGQQRMKWLDSITKSMDMSLSKLWEMWRIEEPGVLQSMRLQRVRHDSVTKQRQQEWSTTN